MAYDEELAARIRGTLDGEPGLTEKKMFGGLAFLVGGNMAAAANSAGALMVRVDPARSDQLSARPGARLVEMRGRPMRGWVHVDAAAVADDASLAAWLELGVAYARSLPPK